MILTRLKHVDRCSFALACKHFCRLAIVYPHHMEDDIAFNTRFNFMSLLSTSWLPPDLHFCFRCNRLRRIDKKLRDDWYSDKDWQKKIMAKDFNESSRMQRGKWCHWKLMLGDKERIAAWCPKCVNETLDPMPTAGATLGGSKNPSADISMLTETSISLENGCNREPS